jgi:hypothetical protein
LLLVEIHSEDKQVAEFYVKREIVEKK